MINETDRIGHVYKIRWLMLFILWLLNFTNGIIWISLSSISDEVADFLQVDLQKFNWCAEVFPLFIVVFGLPLIWLMDKIGLRGCLLICGWLNLCSAIMRYISIYYEKILFPGVLVGQCLGAIAQPLAMFTPAKLASLWFPPNQRATATTIAAMGNPFGILIGLVIPPLLPTSPKYLQYERLLEIGLGILGAVLPSLFVRKSQPLHGPVLSCERDTIEYGFVQQLKHCLLDSSFIVLMLSFGCGVGIFTSLSGLMEQILCSYGYGNSLVSVCGGLLLGTGLVGSFIIGLIADKTRAFITIVQVCLVSASIGLIVFGVFLQFWPPSIIQYVLATSIALFGAFAIGTYSVALELAAEITYPVSENASSGLLVVCGQLCSLIFMLISGSVIKIPANQPSGTYHYPVSVCKDSLTVKHGDKYWIFVLLLASLGVLSSLLMMFLFRGRYRRREVEITILTNRDGANENGNKKSNPNSSSNHYSESSGFHNDWMNAESNETPNQKEDFSSFLDASYTE